MTYRIYRKQLVGELEPGAGGSRFEIQTLRLIADFLEAEDKAQVRSRKLSGTTGEPLSEHFEAIGPDGSAVAIGMGELAYSDEGERLSKPTQAEPEYER